MKPGDLVYWEGDITIGHSRPIGLILEDDGIWRKVLWKLDKDVYLVDENSDWQNRKLLELYKLSE